MRQTMGVTELLKLSYEKLLAYWISFTSNDDGTISTVDEIEKALAEFEARGREDICNILASAGYTREVLTTKEVSLMEATDILLNMRRTNDCRLFTVSFIKRSDGTTRNMLCRYGVTKHLVGKNKTFDDGTYNLTTVWDVNAEPKETGTVKGGYRSISLEGLIAMTINGQEYAVKQTKEVTPSGCEGA